MKKDNLEEGLSQIQTLMQDEKWQPALDALNKLDKKSANTPAILTAKGDCHLHLEHPEQAIPFFTKVTELQPGSVEAWNNLGVAFMFAQDFASAEKTYLEALQFQPDNLATLKNLAFLLYQQEDRVGEAATLLASLIRRHPSDCESLYLMGMCYQQGGQSDSARVCFEQMLAYQPDSILAKDALNALQSE